MTLLLGAMVRIGAAYTQETWPKELAVTSWKVGHSRRTNVVRSGAPTANAGARRLTVCKFSACPVICHAAFQRIPRWRWIPWWRPPLALMVLVRDKEGATKTVFTITS